MAKGRRRGFVTVTLTREQDEKLSRMAEQASMRKETLASSLLTRAIDEAETDGETMVDLLNGIPDALHRAKLGRAQGRRGQTLGLDDL